MNLNALKSLVSPKQQQTEQDTASPKRLLMQAIENIVPESKRDNQTQVLTSVLRLINPDDIDNLITIIDSVSTEYKRLKTEAESEVIDARRTFGG